MGSRNRYIDGSSSDYCGKEGGLSLILLSDLSHPYFSRHTTCKENESLTQGILSVQCWRKNTGCRHYLLNIVCQDISSFMKRSTRPPSFLPSGGTPRVLWVPHQRWGFGQFQKAPFPRKSIKIFDLKMGTRSPPPRSQKKVEPCESRGDLITAIFPQFFLFRQFFRVSLKWKAK